MYLFQVEVEKGRDLLYGLQGKMCPWRDIHVLILNKTSFYVKPFPYEEPKSCVFGYYVCMLCLCRDLSVRVGI